jgi:hypothetical protein
VIALLADFNKFEPHFGFISNLGKNFLAIDFVSYNTWMQPTFSLANVF